MEPHSLARSTNSKLQEVMDIMMTEKRLEQAENIEHMRGLLQVWVGEHRPVRQTRDQWNH